MRAILNFGHTVGHALENVTGYTAYRHGEAVAVGITAACRLGTIGCMSQEEAERVIRLLERYGLPVKLPANKATYSGGDDATKKAVGDQLWFVIPNRIGEVGWPISAEITIGACWKRLWTVLWINNYWKGANPCGR